MTEDAAGLTHHTEVTAGPDRQTAGCKDNEGHNATGSSGGRVPGGQRRRNKGGL